MKIKCNKCNKVINPTVNSTFSNYKVGKIECPYCHNKQRRHIAESDLALYLSMLCLLYTIMAYLLLRVFNTMELNWKFLLIFFGLFIVMFLTQNFVSSFIYEKGIFKKETMNTQQLYEEPDKIKRRLRILFAAYICIIVVLGTSPITLGLFLSVAITFDLIIFLYSLKLARKEKSIK